MKFDATEHPRGRGGKWVHVVHGQGYRMIAPYVTVSHAVDSDRGEIDVGGEDAEGNDIDANRYEKEELESARADARQLANEHGAFFGDEIAGKLYRGGASEELRQQRIAAIAELKKQGKTAGKVQLQEAFAVPRRGTPLRLKFDPRLHPRDRIGKFSEVLGKLMHAPHGSTVELPHGHVVRRDVRGLAVTGGGREVELGTPQAAAAEALVRHSQAEVGRGADQRHESAQVLGELGTARRQVAATDVGDYTHLDSRMKELRRGRRLPEGPKPHVGRSAESKRTDIPLYARNRPAGHPYHGATELSDDPHAQAQNLEKAMAAGRKSQAHAMTGREIDAQTQRTTGPRLERVLSKVSGRANQPVDEPSGDNSLEILRRLGAPPVPDDSLERLHRKVEPDDSLARLRAPDLAAMKEELMSRAHQMSDTEFSVKAQRYRKAGGYWPNSLADWERPQGRALAKEIRRAKS